MKLLAISVVVGLLLGACSSSDKGISEKLTEEFDSSTSTPIDMTQVGPSVWERLCVLGPYSTNETAEQALGFKWDVEGKSEVVTNDGINLLLFVKGQEVLAYSEHRRDKGDFLKLEPRCLTRTQATLVRQPNPGGWVQLVRK